MKKTCAVIILTLILVIQLSILSNAQLNESYEAHGGLETFKSYSTVEYDQEMAIDGIVSLKDHQVIDLLSRMTLINSDAYILGFNGDEAWIKPNMEALGIPPRFYSSTPFYFFGLPFLFADPGVNVESLGTKELDGKKYNIVKVTFDSNIGDTPDDDYVVYMDQETNEIKIVHYIVTYPPLMQGKSIDELERHAAVYEEWQEVDGLKVPKKISFYQWTDDKLADTSAGYMLFENVSFKKEAPDSTIFEKPEGAQVDNSHKAQ